MTDGEKSSARKAVLEKKRRDREVEELQKRLMKSLFAYKEVNQKRVEFREGWLQRTKQLFSEVREWLSPFVKAGEMVISEKEDEEQIWGNFCSPYTATKLQIEFSGVVLFLQHKSKVSWVERYDPPCLRLFKDRAMEYEGHTLMLSRFFEHPKDDSPICRQDAFVIFNGMPNFRPLVFTQGVFLSILLDSVDAFSGGKTVFSDKK